MTQKDGFNESESEPTQSTDLENEIDLKINVSKGQSWTRFLKIEVPSDAVDTKFREMYDIYRGKAKIPGFRPGKAPMSLIEKKFDSEVKAEVLETLVEEAYRQAIIKQNIWPIAGPKLTEIEFEKSKPLKFKAEIEIRPEIKLGKYKGFRVEKNRRKITQKDVDDSVEYMRERMAEFETVERPAMDGDLVIADLLVKFDKLKRLKEDKLENVEVQLGGEGVLKEFREGLTGMRLGEMKEIAVKYPQDYYDSNLAGDEIIYTAVVKEVKNRILPELNDEFVNKVSPHKTVQDFKEALRGNLEKQAENDAVRDLKSELVKKVVDSNNFDVPVSLLNRYLDTVVEDFKSGRKDVDEKTIRERYRTVGENYIRWNFLFHEIARAEEITVTVEDRKKWVSGFAATHDITEDRARELLGKSKKLQDIEESITEQKVLEFIIANSKIIDTEK